jgi:hypothetical protein
VVFAVNRKLAGPPSPEKQHQRVFANRVDCHRIAGELSKHLLGLLLINTCLRSPIGLVDWMAFLVVRWGATLNQCQCTFSLEGNSSNSGTAMTLLWQS